MTKLKVSDLSESFDDFSVQITLRGSGRFYIRSSFADNSSDRLVFSDFLINDDEVNLAVFAFEKVYTLMKLTAAPKLIVFRDIYPLYKQTADKVELVKRHDRLVTVVRRWTMTKNIRPINAFLDEEGSRFGTRVYLEGRP